jgi:hypothetical protein
MIDPEDFQSLREYISTAEQWLRVLSDGLAGDG